MMLLGVSALSPAQADSTAKEGNHRSGGDGEGERGGERGKPRGPKGRRNAPYTVALVGDYNYGCDLDVAAASLTTFAQGTTVPKCAGPLVDDLPGASGTQISGRSKSNRMIEEINAAGVAFSIHDGDTKSGSTECRPTIHAATKAQFNGEPWNGQPNPGFDNPVVYTPGDNEWTDCHRFLAAKNPPAPAAVQATSPTDNLDLLRSTFFAAPASQGRKTMLLDQQDGYPENTRWQRGPVVYLTINQPGSNNNFCSSNQTTTVCDQGGEATARNAANLEWIEDGFAYAEDRNAKAVIVTAQGNPNFERNPANDLPTYDLNGYDGFLNTMREQTEDFDGQVVYVHGDNHAFTFDHPLLDESGVALENFTRIETAGKEDTHWVLLTVDPKGDALLKFEAKTVVANLGNNPNAFPWNVKSVPETLEIPPFAD
jgi:hypothetical protein